MLLSGDLYKILLTCRNVPSSYKTHNNTLCGVKCYESQVTTSTEQRNSSAPVVIGEWLVPILLKLS